MHLKESGENYLETILILKNKKGFVRSVDVATELGFSKPSISRAMGILKDNGFITIENSGNILFTPKGLLLAQNIYERHLLISEFLIKSLGIDSETAENDACRIEHVISNSTFQKIKEYLKQNN